jgi:hypothetical protein
VCKGKAVFEICKKQPSKNLFIPTMQVFQIDYQSINQNGLDKLIFKLATKRTKGSHNNFLQNGFWFVLLLTFPIFS